MCASRWRRFPAWPVIAPARAAAACSLAYSPHTARPLPCLQFGRANVARYLLERGADLSATDDKYGSTALHTASFNGHLDVASILLDWGANVDARNNNSLTPLHYAASNGHVDLAKLFLSRGADPQSKSRAGLSPLDKAQGRPTMVALLRDAIRRTGRRGAGTLIPAAVRNDLRGILAALSAGEDINATDDDGWTALHYAASLGLLAVTRLLLERGASQAVRDQAGLTASQVAAQAGRTDVVQSLADWTNVQQQQQTLAALQQSQNIAAAQHVAATTAKDAPGGVTTDAGHEGDADIDVGPPEDGEDEGEWVATEEDYARYAQYLDDDAEDAGAFYRSKAGAAAMAAAAAGKLVVPSPQMKPRVAQQAPPPMALAPAQPQAQAKRPAPVSSVTVATAVPAAPMAAAVATPRSALSAAAAKAAAEAADVHLDVHARAEAAAQLRNSLAANRQQVEAGHQKGGTSSVAGSVDRNGTAPASYAGDSRRSRRHRGQSGSGRKGRGPSGGRPGISQLRFWVTAAAAAATVLLVRAAVRPSNDGWDDYYDDEDNEQAPAAAEAAPAAVAAPGTKAAKGR